MSRFAAKRRTEADRMADVQAFLVNARDEKVLAETPAHLAQLYGVKDERAVEVKLLARQGMLRRRALA